jgi:hypothetical protein
MESNWVHLALRPPVGLLCQPRVIMMLEKLVECLAGETTVLGGNLPQCRFVHHKPQHSSALTRTRASEMGSQRLTAWALARPGLVAYSSDCTIWSFRKGTWDLYPPFVWKTTSCGSKYSKLSRHFSQFVVRAIAPSSYFHKRRGAVSFHGSNAAYDLSVVQTPACSWETCEK